MSRRVDSLWPTFQFGDVLLVPFARHVTLTAFVVVWALLMLVPALALMKLAFCLALAIPVGFLLLLGGSLVQQAAMRRFTGIVSTNLDHPQQQHYLVFNAVVGSDATAMAFAILTIAACVMFGGVQTWALASCSSRTSESLAELVYGVTNASDVTDWTALSRRPYFATEMLFYQLCLDDLVMTAIWAAISFAGAIIALAVAIHEGQLRSETRRLYPQLVQVLAPDAKPGQLPSTDTLVSKLIAADRDRELAARFPSFRRRIDVDRH